MRIKKKVTGVAMAMPAGLAIATLISFIITLAGSAAVSHMVSTEKLGAESIGYAAMVILAVAAAMGAWSASSLIRKMRLQVCMLAGASYYAVLLAMTALFFGGRYQGMFTTAVIVLLCCGLVAVTPTNNGKSLKIKKRGYR